MAQYYEDFSSHSVGSGVPTGFTARWVTSNVTYSIESSGMPSGAIGGKSLRAVKTAQVRNAISYNAPGTSADVEILVRWSRDSALSSNAPWMGPLARGSGSATSEDGYVGISAGPSYNGGQTTAMSKYDSGTVTILNGDTSLAFAAIDTWHWLRFRVNGTSLQLKQWVDGDAEPGSWLVSDTDSDIATGWVGIFFFGWSTGTPSYYVDYISVGTGGDTAPDPAGNTPPTITVAPTVSYGSLTRSGPNNTPAVVSFTATDPEETGTDELSYEIRTATGGGGTLVASGNCTSGASENVNIAYNATGLSQGSNTLYLTVSDGTDDTEESLTLLVDSSAPTVGTISHTPDPVVS